MELRHLRYLVAVAEELHFGRAAILLNISQPPLSQQIRQLEEELGVRLFQRTKREVRLTEAGRRIVNEAHQVLSQVDHFTKVAARASEGEIGHLSVGAVAGVTDLLVDTLSVFSKRYPGVHIELHHMSTGAQIESLREGRIRVGFLNLPVQESSLTLTFERVKSDPLCVALHKSHRLARQQRVQLSELAKERIIMFPRRVSPGLHDVITGMCQNAGFSLNVAHEVDNIPGSLTLVSADLGVSFCTPGTQNIWPNVVCRPFRESVPHMECAAAYRRDAQSPALDSFLAVVRQAARRSNAKSKKKAGA